MEALREQLGIASWMIVGTSWGTALGLAYAQAHPSRVTAMVLALIHIPSVFTVEWITETMRHVYPREWREFAAAFPRRPGQRMIDACYERITHPDGAVREAAARAWCRWEDAHMSMDPKSNSCLGSRDAAFQLNFATLVTHYWKHAGFLDGADLLENMPRIAHLPGVLIHGRLDISSPMSAAWELHCRWPGSEIIVIPDEGHGGPRMVGEINRAVARFGQSV
jgi:proline iminopeptidase